MKRIVSLIILLMLPLCSFSQYKYLQKSKEEIIKELPCNRVAHFNDNSKELLEIECDGFKWEFLFKDNICIALITYINKSELYWHLESLKTRGFKDIGLFKYYKYLEGQKVFVEIKEKDLKTLQIVSYMNHPPK